MYCYFTLWHLFLQWIKQNFAFIGDEIHRHKKFKRILDPRLETTMHFLFIRKLISKAAVRELWFLNKKWKIQLTNILDILENIGKRCKSPSFHKIKFCFEHGFKVHR